MIKKTIKTKRTAEEMKTYINLNMLSRSEVKSLISSSVWIDNTLNIQSKFGNGTMTLRDNQIDIVINLTLFGKVAKGMIESKLTDGLKELEENNGTP